MEKNLQTFHFDVRKHFPEIDTYDFESKKKLEQTNPFKIGIIYDEKKNQIGEVEGIEVSHQCHTGRTVDNKFQPGFCRVFQGLHGIIQASNFLNAVKRITNHTGKIDLDYINISTTGKPSYYGANILSELEWNEGILSWKNYSKPTKSRYIKPNSNVYTFLKKLLDKSE